MKIAKAKLIAILVMIAALWTLGVADTLVPISPLPSTVPFALDYNALPDYVAPKLAPIVLAQPEPPVVPDSFAITYQWSFSAKEYVLAERPVFTDAFGIKRLDFVAAAGYQLNTATIPTFGAGLAYTAEFSKEGRVFARAGAYVLFPQKSKLDFSLGVSAGIRF